VEWKKNSSLELAQQRKPIYLSFFYFFLLITKNDVAARKTKQRKPTTIINVNMNANMNANANTLKQNKLLYPRGVNNNLATI
jgi:hypothetical protein